MSQFTAATYDVERPTGQCAFTGRLLRPGETYMATLVEFDGEAAAGESEAKSDAAASLGLRRIDVSGEAWSSGQRPPRLFSHWRATVPAATQKKKLFVDDQVLLNLLERLEDTRDEQRLAFRFVLCLILMRKKLLAYERGEKASADEGGEWWIVRRRGGEQTYRVLDPHLDEQRIEQVTSQLSQILEAEL